MEVDMSLEEVMEGIRRLEKLEKNLNKKKIKKSHPQLMKNALYYFSDWEQAKNRSTS
ncbi:hypothetical protein NC661_16440 [Aquibacillus koreensis]|uniref:Uncharacterized protein n=1 Tax=Aquibacillus koreensis TaxID=279446 RepID=A0A9X3WNF7_9BACI|nr:hypothetical protein [Aquibacillus koreensis]MCT2536906.1 hypothetical protein [Aquibacillus koreensis]MDC3421963.1 hypothetical protein [Aquibacillus koreensis]